MSQVRAPPSPISRSQLNTCVAPEVPPSLPTFNAEAMAQLEGMGFPTVRCQKALLATGNADPNAAMEWLFAHMEDPGMSFLKIYDTPKSLIKVQTSTIQFPSAVAALRVQSHLRNKLLC